METLQVQAQGAHLSDSHILVLIVSVKEADGTPVEGLTLDNFSIQEMGQRFGSLTPNVFQDLDALDDLKSVYQIGVHHWAPAVDGTFCHHVLVERGEDRGSCLSFVVKVGGKPE